MLKTAKGELVKFVPRYTFDVLCKKKLQKRVRRTVTSTQRKCPYVQLKGWPETSHKSRSLHLTSDCEFFCILLNRRKFLSIPCVPDCVWTVAQIDHGRERNRSTANAKNKKKIFFMVSQWFSWVPSSRKQFKRYLPFCFAAIKERSQILWEKEKNRKIRTDRRGSLT